MTDHEMTEEVRRLERERGDNRTSCDGCPVYDREDAASLDVCAGCRVAWMGDATGMAE